MQLGNPLVSLHEALASAVHRDLPDVSYQTKDWVKSKEQGVDVFRDHVRRPFGSEVEVMIFNQIWGSTALGYGGLGGAAMTNAYTTICTHAGVYCVYFGQYGVLAYKIIFNKLKAAQRKALLKIIADNNMPARREALNMFKGAIEVDKTYDE